MLALLGQNIETDATATLFPMQANRNITAEMHQPQNNTEWSESGKNIYILEQRYVSGQFYHRYIYTTSSPEIQLPVQQAF